MSYEYEYSLTASSAIKPFPDLNIWQWADAYRKLPRESSNLYGDYQSSITPYTREIMEVLSPQSTVQEVTVMKGTQLGFTEIGINLIFYIADIYPLPVLVILPTDGMVSNHIKKKIDPSILLCDKIINKVRNPKTKDGSTFSDRLFPGGSWSFASAKTVTGIRSQSIAIIILDDIDAVIESDDIEGDYCEVVEKRTDTYANKKKIYRISTPLLKGTSRIEYYYDKSPDKRQYFVPCPYCREYQKLEFQNFDIAQAMFSCISCKKLISEGYKTEMLDNGSWQCVDNTSPNKHERAYQISSFYSPIGWVSWKQIAMEYLRSKGYPKKEQVFANTRKGETYVQIVTKKVTDDLKRHICPLKPLTVPNNTIAVTAGIDPGQGGFWYVCAAWTRNPAMTYIIDYGFLQTWDDVTDMIVNWSYPSETGSRRYTIWRVGIDTGGSQKEYSQKSMTDEAYDYIRSLGLSHVYGTKGKSHRDGKLLTQSPRDKMPGSNKLIPGGLFIWMMDTDAFKDSIHFKLQRQPRSKNSICFHRKTNEELFEQILSEEKQKEKNKEVWKQTKKNNHYLDCIVICLAMANPECNGGTMVLNDIQEDIPQQKQLFVKKDKINDNKFKKSKKKNKTLW